MKNIKFRIYHPSLDILSDRTLRSILKKFSTLLKEIQFQEILYLINSSELSPSEKQSLRDRLRGPLNHIDSYYVEKIERGSLIIEAALTATGLWVLKNTLGESVKDAYKQSKMHKSLVSYLSNSQERKDVIDRNIDRVFDAWNFDGYVVESIEKDFQNEDTLKVTINIDTSSELKEHINKNVVNIDADLVIKELKEEIIRLDSLK